MGFVFYDLETTGISPQFDQPLQFAAIRTDEYFTEIERVNLRCRLAPHIIPTPQALTLTGVTPAQITDPTLPTLFEFTQGIVELTERWAPATWVGYNSMKFDEEVLRQTFYQNLQPNIFATQFHGNSRLDILTAVYAAKCRNPDLFHWPVDETDRMTFKLDRLASENGFAVHKAHDAVGDIEATIYIARRIADGDPTLWSEMLENRDKQKVQAKLETFQPVELVSRFRGASPQSYLGCFCGYSAGNSTQAAFFDFEAGDPTTLLQADTSVLFEAIDGRPKIIRSISTNRAPALFTVREPDPEHLLKSRLIAERPDFRQRVGQAMAARFVRGPDAPSQPVEKQIYDGFYSNTDHNLLVEFQRNDWRRRQEIVSTFADPRLRQLGRRLVALHSPNLLAEPERMQFQTFLRERWNAPDLPETEWTTINRARRDLRDLRQNKGIDPAMLDVIDSFINDLVR